METHILKDIPFVVNLDSLKQRLRIRENNSSHPRFQSLVEEAQRIARPKALYRPVFIEERNEEAVKVEGKWFRSRILTVNLRQAHRIFLYVATCGAELDKWAKGQKDILKAFWAEAVKETALRNAVAAVGVHLEDRYHPGRTAHQNPGSLKDFPLTEQEALFALMGDTRESIGLTLLPSLMMSPTHSVSGIIFPTTEDFQSCLLCPREKCPGRRAAYDPTLYARKYATKSLQHP
jgi:hypothetical protein